VPSKTLRVAFYADITYNAEGYRTNWIPPENLDVDAILLGGDIHYQPELLASMFQSIHRTQRSTTQIVYVPGNGEHCHQELSESRRAYRAAVADVPNAVILDNEVFELSPDHRVIGSTLWSPIPKSERPHYEARLVKHGLSGVDDIRLGSRWLTWDDVDELYAEARSFIEKELRKLSPAERAKTIVCTHYWPTLRPWLEMSDVSEYIYEIASDMDAMIAEVGPKFWLCGHAHVVKSVTIGSTQVSSNPYVWDRPNAVNPDFNDKFIIEF